MSRYAVYSIPAFIVLGLLYQVVTMFLSLSARIAVVGVQ